MKKLIYEKYGDASVMHIENLPPPSIKDGEVLINVKAASINPVDYKIRNGKMQVITGYKFPKGMGIDFSGIVQKVGNKIKHLKKNDEVFGWINYKKSGTFSELVVADADFTIAKPENITFEEASGIPLAGTTAYEALHKKAKVKANMQVLINGCTGGVGHIASQLAKHVGAVVTGTCSQNHIEAAKKLGVDKVIDYNEKDVTAADKKFDIIFDTAGTLKFSDAKKIMNPSSTFVTTKPGPELVGAFITNLFIGKKYKLVTAKPNRLALLWLKELAEGGHLKIIVDKTFPLAEAKEAIQVVEQGGDYVGKIVITPN